MTPSTTTEQTMSSREIAELTGKRHPDVKRDVRAMLEALELDVSRFAHIKKDTRNRSQEEYLLNKDLTLTLVTGYDVTRRYKLVQRWQALEEQASTPAIDYANPAHALKFLEEQAKRVVALTLDVDAKNEVLDTFGNTDSSYSPTDAAKQIGIKPKELLAYMRGRENGWLYRRRVLGQEKGPYIAFQSKLDDRHLKVITIFDNANKPRDQIRLRKKGVLLLAQQIAKKNVERNQIEQR